MASPTDVVTIESNGSVKTTPALDKELSKVAGRYRVFADVPGLLILHGEQEPDFEARARVLMAGEIVSQLTVMEVCNVIASANWRGHLHVFGPEHHRTLSFDQGALKQARSDAPDDRLGEVLYRAGAIDRPALEELLKSMSGDQRLGALCVQRGIVDQQTLYQHLLEQARHVFFSALLVAEGRYVFVLPDGLEELSSTTVHLSVQGLLMEGVQRVDEMALFRDKIPNSRMCPAPRPDAPRRSLDPQGMAVLQFCDGRLSIEEIARASGLGEFATTKAVYQLMQQGQLLLRSAPSRDDGGVRALISSFNDVLSDIFAAVAAHGGLEQTRSTLEAWIEGSGYGPFFGNSVDETGHIDAAKVAKAMDGVSYERPLEGLHQALHELSAFALFSATTTLPRERELSLTRDVNARLKAIRIE